LRDRLRDEALLQFRSEDLSAKRDHDKPIKHEAALPEHQGDEEDETAEDDHLSLILISVMGTRCQIVPHLSHDDFAANEALLQLSLLAFNLASDDSRLDEMLPDKWAANHSEAVLTYRLEESRRKAAAQSTRRRHARGTSPTC
jgi:hypothetical protein